MTPAEIISAVVGTGGFGTGVVMLVRSRSANRRTNADAAQVLAGASAAYAEGIAEDMAALRKEFDDFRREQQRRDREQDRLHREHSRWDYQAAQQIRDLGGEIADPPALYPAT